MGVFQFCTAIFSNIFSSIKYHSTFCYILWFKCRIHWFKFSIILDLCRNSFGNRRCFSIPQRFFEYSRLFFQSSLTSRYNYIDTTSLIYVVNPSLKKHTPSYQTTQGSICLDFVDTIAPSLFLLLFLSMANRISERTIPYYRNRLNKIKLNTHSLKNCLLLRFEFEKNIAPYESLLSDSTRYSNAQLALQNLLSKRSLPSDDVYLLSNLLLSEKNSLLEQITELKNEFDKKVEILEHLVSYKRESRNLRFSWLSAITATITLYFLIYPDKTKPVALFINNLIRLITTFLFKEV